MLTPVAPRPLIRTDENYRHPTVKAGITLLNESEFIFQYNRRLYQLVTYFPFQFRRMTTLNVQLTLERWATWEKFDRRRKRWVVISPPPEVCRFILCHGVTDWPFPHLTGIDPVIIGGW